MPSEVCVERMTTTVPGMDAVRVERIPASSAGDSI
jgi:hypothetical protein